LNRAIAEVIGSSSFSGGPYVAGFEEKFASFCGARHAIGVGNGTDALWLSLLACEVGAGDEVITVPNTFMATAEAITYCGAKPVFVDVDPVSYTMDPAGLAAALTARTKAIIPVHLFGQPADLTPIVHFARAHGLRVIEDAAQAHGAKYKGHKVGALADAGCFSFYPGKNLGAFGEAGAVVTNDSALEEKIRILRDHGQTRKYHHTMVGWNCRMDGIQGAVLEVKLRHLDHGNALRRKHAARYTAAFQSLEQISAPAEMDYAEHVYHIYAIRVQERDQIINRLQNKDISCGIHYPVPVHLQTAYRSLGYAQGSFEVSEGTSAEFVSLPMFPELTEAQIEHVITCVEEAVSVLASV
jgi:dTDP-4-amino-4,6-dideoxygalactose transaminase